MSPYKHYHFEHISGAEASEHVRNCSAFMEQFYCEIHFMKKKKEFTH